jgi:hypothetical protein
MKLGKDLKSATEFLSHSDLVLQVLLHADPALQEESCRQKFQDITDPS